jgi:hypothetical protein
MVHMIKNIVNVEPYTLTLQFNTGETKKINIEKQLREWSQTPESKFRQLLEPNYFTTVKLDKELETVYWDNGIDFCPDVLYSLSSNSL